MTAHIPRAIIGAGLAGLAAAYAFPAAPVLEAAQEGSAPHRALLRFRSPALSNLTGIPFRAVQVRKGIWSEGRFAPPSIRLANMYARKCLGALVGDRSIWQLAAAERWVGPEDLLEQMTEVVRPRIEYSQPYDFEARRHMAARTAAPIISTAPLAIACKALDPAAGELPKTLRSAPIATLRYRVEGADVHQTVYFPDEATPIYRASITGDMLIVEARTNWSFASEQSLGSLFSELQEVTQAFGLGTSALSGPQLGQQRFGKIVPLPDVQRRRLLARLTMEAGVYSLGRFATWRNVLMDDVVHDLDVIRRLLRTDSSHYDVLRAAAGRSSA